MLFSESQTLGSIGNEDPDGKTNLGFEKSQNFVVKQ